MSSSRCLYLALGGEHSFGSAALTSMKSLATNVRGGIRTFLWTLDCGRAASLSSKVTQQIL